MFYFLIFYIIYYLFIEFKSTISFYLYISFIFTYYFLFILIYLYLVLSNLKEMVDSSISCILTKSFTFPEGFAIKVFSQMLYNLTYITKSDRKLQSIKIVKRLVKHIVDSFKCFIFAHDYIRHIFCLIFLY